MLNTEEFNKNIITNIFDSEKIRDIFCHFGSRKTIVDSR